DDLIYSIKHQLNPKAPGVAANLLRGLDVNGMKKLDNLTVSVPFAKPYTTLPEVLSLKSNSPLIIPVGWNVKHPIGTGPFKLTSFTPGKQATFARYENYWNGPAHLDHVILTDFSDEDALVNALIGGQIDVATPLSQQTIGTVEGSGKKALISLGGGWNPLIM